MFTRLSRPRRLAVAAALVTGCAVLGLLPDTAQALPESSDCTPTWSLVSTPDTTGSITAWIAPLSDQDAWFSLGSPARTLRWNGHAITDAPTAPWTPSEQLLGGASFDSAQDGWMIGVAPADGSKYTTPTYLYQPPWLAHWNKSSWTEVPVPLSPTPDQTYSDPQAIAALSPTDAWTVGKYQLPGYPGGSKGALTQHWDGHRWSAVANPADHTDDTQLRAITAISADDVWAVGSTYDAEGTLTAFAEHYDGHRWTTVDLPARTGPSTFTAVSATAAGDVWAVGGQTKPGTASEAEALVEHFDGTTWSIADTADLGNTELAGVYAATPTDIWASEQLPGKTPLTMVHYDGTSWTTVPWPGPAEYGYDYLPLNIAGSGSHDVWATVRVLNQYNLTWTVQIAHLSCAGGTE